MTLQYSTPVHNARLDAIESVVGTSAKLKIYSGTKPDTCATAATGVLLVDITLPADWMNAAASASKTKLGTWSALAAAAGIAGYFRITDSTSVAVGIQGSAGMTGTDMILDNSDIAIGQTVTVNSFTINSPV